MVSAARSDEQVRESLIAAGYDPELVADRLEFAVREAYIRGTGDGCAQALEQVRPHTYIPTGSL